MIPKKYKQKISLIRHHAAECPVPFEGGPRLRPGGGPVGTSREEREADSLAFGYYGA